MWRPELHSCVFPETQTFAAAPAFTATHIAYDTFVQVCSTDIIPAEFFDSLLIHDPYNL